MRAPASKSVRGIGISHANGQPSDVSLNSRQRARKLHDPVLRLLHLGRAPHRRGCEKPGCDEPGQHRLRRQVRAKAYCLRGESNIAVDASSAEDLTIQPSRRTSCRGRLRWLTMTTVQRCRSSISVRPRRLHPKRSLPWCWARSVRPCLKYQHV